MDQIRPKEKLLSVFFQTGFPRMVSVAHEPIAGSPPLLAMMWVSLYGQTGLFEEIACIPKFQAIFPLPLVFLVSTNSLQRFWGLVVWMLLIGTASHPGPGLGVKLINVGGWLANCDKVLETKADFLVVTEHRLVPARTRSESKRLKAAGFYSLWTPACQESAHVGHAGVGLVILKGASLFHAVPSTHDFRVWVRLGRVLRSVIPVGKGRVVHVVVVYGFQGADGDPEKLARTEHLFQAVMCELRVVGDGHPGSDHSQLHPPWED